MNRPELLPGEKIVFSEGIHWKNYLIPYIELAFFAALAGLRIRFWGTPLLIPLAKYAGARYYATVCLAELLLTAIFTAVVFSKIVRLVTVGYYITDQRIVCTSGFLTKKTTEMRLEKCETVSMKKNAYERLFSTGDIILVSAGTSIYLDDVPKADRFKKTILELLASGARIRYGIS